MPCSCRDCTIRATLARYHVAGDRGQLEVLAETFTVDGILETRDWRAVGRSEIVTRLRLLMQDTSPLLGIVRHHLTTSLIEDAGSQAVRATSYFMVVTDIGLDHMGDYTDRLVSDEGKWLIAERRARLRWVSPSTLFGLAPIALSGQSRASLL